MRWTLAVLYCAVTMAADDVDEAPHLRLPEVDDSAVSYAQALLQPRARTHIHIDPPNCNLQPATVGEITQISCSAKKIWRVHHERKCFF